MVMDRLLVGVFSLRDFCGNRPGPMGICDYPQMTSIELAHCRYAITGPSRQNPRGANRPLPRPLEFLRLCHQD